MPGEERAKSLTKEIDDVMRSIRRVKGNLATALIREEDPGLEGVVVDSNVLVK